MNRRVRWILTILAGALIAGLVLTVVEREIGFRYVLDTLQAANRVGIFVVFALGVLWIGVWGYSFHLVFTALGERYRYRESLLLYSTLLLWNIIAPFSFGGGEPIAAYFISRATGRPYESTLIAVITTDGLNYSPAPVLAVVGIVFVASMMAVGTTLRTVAVTTTGILVGLAAAGYIGWRNRERIHTVLADVVMRLQRRHWWGVPSALQPVLTEIERRISLIGTSFERLTRDRRVLRIGFGAATLGWIVQAAMLWVSLAAVGSLIPFWTPVVVITVVAVTDVFPVPGGIGAVDAALVLVLVSVTSIDPVLAVTGTLVFRVATLGLPVLIGLGGLGILSIYPFPNN